MHSTRTVLPLLAVLFVLVRGDCPPNYDTNNYVCVGGVLCPKTAPNACGQACYSTASYGCCNGQLTPAGQGCGSGPATNPPSNTGPSSSSGSTGGYTVDTVYAGENVYSSNLWNYFTGGDPTHGNVQYLSYNDAMSNGLLSYSNLGNNYFSSTIRSSPGTVYGTRKSVRLSSKKRWNRGLFIMEFSHMPAGCATWPAWWLLSSAGSAGAWPQGGEIDIVEGVNNQNANAATLHTVQGCNQAGQSSWGGGNGFGGQWSTGSAGNNKATDCYIHAANQYDNQGCGIVFPQNSFGQGFNNGGGGTYALEVTDSFIKVWFFPQGSYSWSANPNPGSWPVPTAYFVLNGNCPASLFYDFEIIINLTFCGDWAGGVFGQMCGGDCTAYVANNQGLLNSNAYWAINSITTYTK